MVEPFVVALISPSQEGDAVARALAASGFEVQRVTGEGAPPAQAQVILLDLSSFAAFRHAIPALRQAARSLSEQLRAPVVMIARHDVVPADVAMREEVRGHLTPAEVEGSLAATLRAAYARHRDEERLRAKEAQIRNLLQETGHAFFSVDLDGINLETSPTELAMLGYEREREIVGRSSLETHWLDPARRDEFMAAILKRGKLTGYRMTFKKKGGRELVWALGSCHLERDASGQAVKITGFYRDETEAYAEFLYHAALSLIVRKVRRVDDLPEVVCKTACEATVARVGLFLVRDDAIGALVVHSATGLRDEERRRFVGAPLPLDAFLPGVAPAASSPLAELSADLGEDLLFCPVGDPAESRSYLALLGRHAPVAGDARMLRLEGFLKNAADYLRTTVRLQIEGLYRAIQAALRGPEGGSMGVDHILELLLLALRREVPFEAGAIYRVVPAGARTRLQVAAATGDRRGHGRSLTGSEGSDAPVREFLKQLEGRHGRDRRAAAADAWGLWSAVPIRALNGREVGLLYAANRRGGEPGAQPSFSRWDVEIFEAAAEHAALVISLLAAEDKRSGLLAHVTHEIRAPVNSIRSYVDVLSRQPHSTEQERRFKHLRLDADVLLDLAHKLDGLFGSPRAPAGLPSLVPIEPMLREIVERMEPELEERRISPSQIELRLDALLLVQMDKIHLWQVFFNLFENALKYAEPEPSRFRVQITGSLTGRAPVVRFRDRGIGVLEADQKRIFERGERGSNIHEVQARGTGLGLFICRQHMQDCGGSITLTTLSKPTEFTLQFPDPTGKKS